MSFITPKQTTPPPATPLHAQLSVPTSEKLESLQKDLADKKALAVVASAELLRLTNLIRNDSYDATVINRERPATHATFTVWDEPVANLSTGLDWSKFRDDDRERVLRGEPLTVRSDVRSQIEDANRYCRAVDDAIESIIRNINKEKAVLAHAYCEKLKPAHFADMKLLFKALADAHAVHLRLNTLRQFLIDSGIGFRGVCLLMPDAFLGHPRSPSSDMAAFFQSGKEAGYIDTIPKEYVL
jgi:hypothetical protein